MKKILLFLLLLFIILALIYHYKPEWMSENFSHWFLNSNNKNELVLYGNVDIRQVDLGFRVSGRVETMPFQEGDFVPAGSFDGDAG